MRTRITEITGSKYLVLLGPMGFISFRGPKVKGDSFIHSRLIYTRSYSAILDA